MNLRKKTDELNSGVVVTGLFEEWKRIEFLVHCLQQNRRGVKIKEETLGKLKKLGQRVRSRRDRGETWKILNGGNLSPLEYDILACSVCVEVQPRLGGLFQKLQGGNVQPYPTSALLQELLAVDESEIYEFYSALRPSSTLRRRQLIWMERDEPHSPIIPGPGITDRLLGLEVHPPAPLGTQKVSTRVTWKDLVLPHEKINMLKEFLLWIHHRETVVRIWKGNPTGGPVALFSGPSGTGKTLAASVLAAELGWPVYRADLGKLISKYIGETEKNFNRLFDSAHGQNMVLLFDEADSLFGKRAEVKDARDRYANMEVSHLLARIEDHRGPCILTTNLQDHLDSAFSRRFQMVIEFPLPDRVARGLLWGKLLPSKAPREKDVDPEFLGGAVNLTGGGIRNAALHSAYLAAEEKKPIHLSHVALAVWRELAKDSITHSRSDMGPLAQYLPEDI